MAGDEEEEVAADCAMDSVDCGARVDPPSISRFVEAPEREGTYF